MGIDRGATKKDIENLCVAQIEDFRKNLRPSMNEWMLQDFDEWYDQLNIVLEKDRKNGIVTVELFQDWLAVAQEYKIKLLDMIRQHEKEEDYITRLCQQK